MENELRGKNAIVTGGRKGIGRQIVVQLAQQGVNLWVSTRKPDSEFEADMRQLEKEYGVWIEPVYFDLLNYEEMEAALKGIIAEKKSIDILVNNAGIAYGGMLVMQSMKMFHDTFDVNFFGPMFIIQYISKAMIRQKGGNIINIASVSGCENYGGNISYGASKAALIWATRELSKELAPFGIRVNAVSPGTTETDMGKDRTKQQMDSIIERIAMKRPAQTDEIANAVVFLASAQSSYITGQNIVVDGGRLH